MFHRFTLTLIWLILSMGPGYLQASTLDELRQYIHSRTQQTEQIVEIAHCGFGIQFELQQRLNELDSEYQTLAKTLLTEPVRHKSILSPKGYFTLNYDTTGYNAIPLEDLSGNGIPDYVDSAAIYFDHVWNIEINQMGFAAPPDMEGQPKKPYPIYFTKFGFYGQTSFNTDDDIASIKGYNYPSYIEIHSDYFNSHFFTSGYRAMQVTAAHEFNHAIQLGYNFRSSDIYFMEMTSTWMEDFVYEDVNDYLQYLPRYVQNLYYKSFTSYDGNSEYAAGLYLHMLENKFGWQAIPDIWQRTRDDEALVVLDHYLKSQGSSFAKSHIDYATWLYFTGTRAIPGEFFPEGSTYPLIQPQSEMSRVEDDLSGLSMRHVYILVDSSLVYRANLEATEGQGVFNHLNNGQYTQGAHPFGDAQIFSQNSNQPLVVVMTNPESDKITGIRYTLLENPDWDKPQIYTRQTTQGLSFYNIAPQSKITIFNLNGLKLQTIKSGTSLNGWVDWDARERSGNLLSTGVYLFYVQGIGKPYLGKFSFVRK